ncbi:NAD(P)/FAD-dependent oxidoreductase [Paraburkholderia fungorum]|uniref:NAD(P)/FAD-dependent oxidoreductase n=1 Tax=Paraburkholderia fungorum TaxID=134537 RepID=UPI0038780A75
MPIKRKGLRIAVVGAGIAGLSCATVLRRSGFEVNVFDKSRGPAGRMSTRREGDRQCDHGAQYFTARDPLFQAEVARWQNAGVAAIWPARIAVLDGSARTTWASAQDRFVGTPSMNAPAKFLAGAQSVTLGCTVTALHRDGRQWRLESAEQGTLAERFDVVVLAMPAPQAADLLREPATRLAALASKTKMRPCWALMVRLPERLPVPFDAAFINEGPLRWIARDSSKPGRNGPETWLLHANAEWSELYIDASAERVADCLLEAFALHGGQRSSEWTAHRWRFADTAASDEPAPGYIWDEASGLAMCGDWLNGGRVEGAWLSGRMLGKQIASGWEVAPKHGGPRPKKPPRQFT